MERAKKEVKNVDNGLKRFIQRFVDPGSKRMRLDYAEAVVDYLKKPENGGYEVTRNHIYLLVNNHIRVTPGNIHIAKAVKTVCKQFADDLEDLAA